MPRAHALRLLIVKTTNPMKTHFQFQRRVEFVDTDMAGISHFSNFFRYMEEAEHAFLRNRGLSVVLHDDRGKLGFPKLSATCDFRRPMQFESVVDIDVTVSCDDEKTISYQCRFSQGDDVLAEGELRVALCRFPPDRPPYAIPIRGDLLDKLAG